MALITFSPKGRYQPSSRPPLNWRHPAFRGLVGLWVPWYSSQNLVGTANSVFATAWVTGNGSVGGRFSGEASAESQILTASTAFATAFTTGTATTLSTVCSRGPTATGQNGQGLAMHATHTNASYAGAVYCGSAYSIIGKPTGGALANNTRYVLGGGVSGGIGAVFNNGIRTGSATGLSTPVTTGRLSLGIGSALIEGWTVAPAFEYYAQWNYLPGDDLFAEIAFAAYDVFFAPRRLFFPVSGGGSVTVALSGFAAASAVGSLAVTNTRTLSGSSAASSTGTLLPSFSLALTGSSAASAIGTVIPSIAIGLIGISATASAGTLTATGGTGGGATLTGYGATVGIGTLGVTITLPLSGTAATVALGTLSPTSGSATITIQAGSWIRYRKIP